MVKVKFTEMFKHSPFEAPDDTQGTWTFDAENQELRRRKKAGQDTEGDIKVTYAVFKTFHKRSKPDMKVTAIGRQKTIDNQSMALIPLEEFRTMLVRHHIGKSDFIN